MQEVQDSSDVSRDHLRRLLHYLTTPESRKMSIWLRQVAKHMMSTDIEAWDIWSAERAVHAAGIHSLSRIPAVLCKAVP